MAEAIVSTLAERLKAMIEEQNQSDIYLVRGLKKEVLNLALDLNTLRNVLDDAENRRFLDIIINYWLSRLEQKCYEMEDVLDEWDYVLLKLKMAGPASPKHKVCSFIPSLCLCFQRNSVHHVIAHKIKDLKEKIDQLLREKDRYGFVPTTVGLPNYLQVESTFFTDSSALIYGRDVDVDILVEKLTCNGDREDESYIPVLSIVGMGGLGKTTLARLVYNHSRVEEYFELRIWVYVSDPFDMGAIVKCILERIGEPSSPNTEDLDVLFGRLKILITGKMFLLVLDDVWTEDQCKWEPLEYLLRYGRGGSKILVTSRSERVVKMMGSRESGIFRPGLLTDEECWLLLSHMTHVGKNKLEFETLGKTIARKCSGLPLAAKILGGLLRFKNSLEEWKTVLNSEIWGMEEGEVDNFAPLLLSYNHLSPALKLCFSYCAVFPINTEIVVEDLIGKWMALGYLGSSIGDMELNGREFFNILAMRSLFQDFEIDDDSNKKIIRCKMHDIVRDFAKFLIKSRSMERTRMNMTTCQAHSFLVSTAKEFRSLFLDYTEPSLFSCDCLICLRVLSLKQSIPKGMEKLIYLRWLDLSGNTLSEKDLKIIFQLFYLQTLISSNCNLEEIPSEIEFLIHLRRLDLSWNSLKKLPREIGNLIQLKHLDLSYNRLLKELPSEFGKLTHLKELNMRGNVSLEELPESMCGLHELGTLDISNCTSLSRIPDGMTQLTGPSSHIA